MKCKTILYCLFFIGASLLITYLLQKKQKNPPNFNIQFSPDHLLSQTGNHLLHTFFLQNPDALQEQAIKTELRCIGNTKKNDRGMHIIEIAKPTCIINKKWALVENGLVEIIWYSPSILEALPEITVSEESMQKSEQLLALHTWILTLCPDILTMYSISWHTKNDIVLLDKQRPIFAIKITVDTQLTPAIIARCNTIKESLAVRAKPIPEQWLADIRFAKHIVVSAKHKESHERHFI